MMGIRKTVTPPYCPRGDRVERAHQVLGEILRSDKRGPDADWARKLPEATLAYNIATNRVTGVSPYEAVFGQKAVLPVDFLFPCHKSRETTMAHAIDTRRSQMNQLVQRMLNLEQRTIQLDSRYRPKEVKNPLKVGDTVYMFVTRLTPQVSAKLQSRWTGPWAVSQIASLSLVELSPIGSWSKSKRTVTTTVDRVHVVDLESLDHHDLHPADPVDVDAEGIILGDEDEGEIVIPSRGFYDAPSPGDDVTETLPGMAIKQEVQDEVCTDLYDDYEPEVVIPEGIPVAHDDASSPGGDTDEPQPEDDLEVRDEFHDETEDPANPFSPEPQAGPSSGDTDPPVTKRKQDMRSTTSTDQALARGKKHRERRGYAGGAPGEYKGKLRSASKSVSSKPSK